MNNEINISTSDNNMDPKSSMNRESVFSEIRSKLIGGLNKEDVNKFIGIIDEKYRQLEQEMKKQMDVVTSSRNKLQVQYQVYVSKSMEEKKRLQESLEKAQNDLATYIDENKNKGLTVEPIDDNNSEIARLQKEVQQISEERKKLEKQLSVSRLETERMKESAGVLEQENNVLKLKIVDLEKEISSNVIQDENGINKVIQELEQQLEFEKSRNKKQSIDLENYNRKVNNLEETIAKNTQEIEHRKISEKDEQEFKMEKARISSSKITEFKDEIEHIYRKLENLSEEQVTINNELQQQLEIEQLRANKAENGLAELIKWVSELKDKLYSEQNLFVTQFKQFTDSHDRIQSEINGCWINLQDSCNLYTQSK